MRSHRLVPALIATALFMGGEMAAAQTQAVQHPWDVEVHGGGMWASGGADGTAALPPEGPSAGPMIGFAPPSRIVSSWLFGDGAAQLNQALTSVRLSASLTPLDPVVQSRFVERRPGASVGFRIGRTFTPRFGAEFSFDYGFGTLALTGTSASGIEATRGSFVNAWNTLLSGPARGAQTVSAIATVTEDRGRQAMTTGTVLVNFSQKAMTPYVALGAGVVANLGTPPSATLLGDYQFLFTPAIPTPPPPGIPPPPILAFHETDTVTVRSSIDNALVWVVGGGFKYAVSTRWGVRVDVRDSMSGNRVTTRVDARPASIPVTPSGIGALTIGTTPSVRFGTSALAGASTLSGTPLSGFETFRGTGTAHRISLTTGLFWRF